MPEHDVSLTAAFRSPEPGKKITIRTNISTHDGKAYYRPAGVTRTETAEIKDGYAFREWEFPEGLTVTKGDKKSKQIDFTVPDHDVTLKALYDPIPNPFGDVHEDNYFYYAVL